MMLDPDEILKSFWGFNQFKGSQKMIITAALEGKDVLALLPTGGGKSICYQIPALAKDGICIVVSPLIALIQNQVSELKGKGIKAIALTGGIPFNELNDLLDNCLYGNFKFLYLSPERLQQDLVQERIHQMNVNLIAIDEAHCISQWGNDFRPSYLGCSVLRELAPNAPVMALTATATPKVAKDILDNLKLRLPLTIKDSFSRDNISFKVIWDEDKRGRLKNLCAQLKESGIVYVRSRKLSEELSRYLEQQKISTTYYHGGIPKKEKEAKLNLWLQDKVKVMVATNAFGMGIDKAAVRLVVHYQIPESLESYFQEAGRAGRDQRAAEAIVITNKADTQQVRQQFLSVLPNIQFLRTLYNKLNNYFQIPYGEGANETFALRLNLFCDIYKFNTVLAYNGLRILDQNSVIALSDNFTNQTTVRFIAPKQVLFQYMDNNPKAHGIIQALVRTYGGIFDFVTKINTLLLAKKAKTSEEHLLQMLKQMEKDNILAVQLGHTDLEVTFLVPREDDRTINAFGKKVEQQQQVKTNSIDSMLAYIYNDKVCRSKQLLYYFGEDKGNCGICDVCLQTKKVDPNVLPLIIQDVMRLLEQNPHASKELVQKLPYKEQAILLALQELLEDERIFINTKNQYAISR